MENKLKELRLAAGLSQAQLAEVSGIGKKTIQDYEQGYRDIKKAQGLTLLALAKALGCIMEDLMSDE